MSNLYTSGRSSPDKLYKHSGFSTTISSSIEAPSSGPTGCSWGNDQNIYSSDCDEDRHYKHSGFSTTISSSISSPSTTPTDISWANAGSDLYTSDASADKFYNHSGFSTTISSSIASTSSGPEGICWGFDDNLYNADRSGDKIYKHSGFSTTISSSIASPTTNPSGVSWHDRDSVLYSSDTTDDKDYKHSGFSTTISSSFSAPNSTPSGIDWENRDNDTAPPFNPSNSLAISLSSSAVVDREFNPIDSLAIALASTSAIDREFNPSDSLAVSLASVAGIAGTFNPSDTLNVSLASTAAVTGLLYNPSDSASISLDSVASIIVASTFNPSDSLDISLDSAASIAGGFNPSDSLGISLNSSASITFGIFVFRWSIEHLEARLDIPGVYVEANNTAIPTGPFPSGKLFEKRLLEPLPVLAESQLNTDGIISGLKTSSLVIDNSDNSLSGIDFHEVFFRMFFADKGSAYKEYRATASNWSLGAKCRVNLEDMDAVILSEQLPKRSVSQALFPDAPANDLGKVVPIVFGRNKKIRLLYIKADGAVREYDYLIGEGQGYNSGNFEKVTRVYRKDVALDEHEGDAQSGWDLNTIVLESIHNRTNNWYQYWWCELLDSTGTTVLDTVDVISSDSASSSVELSRNAVLGGESNPKYRLREWRFYDGSQLSPDYPGFAFIRFKKRQGDTGTTDTIHADVGGLQEERNVVRAIQSILTNSNWGLGLTVSTSSFDTAAALSEITAMLCEGNVSSGTRSVDVFRRLFFFRGITLNKADLIEIAVDGTKVSSRTLGLGDDTGYNNILDFEPEIKYPSPEQIVKNLKYRYRRNNRETDAYMHEIERSSNNKGINKIDTLRFVYDHGTADRINDYWRKRLADPKTLRIGAGEDAKTASRAELVTVKIPTLGIASQDWEVESAALVIAGPNVIELRPYNASAYTYEASPSLPADEDYDIQTDFTKTPPEPLTGVAISYEKDFDEQGHVQTFAVVSFTPPVENYDETRAKIRKNGSPNFEGAGSGDTRIRIPVIPGISYDYLLTPYNETNLPGIPDSSLVNELVPGDTTSPKPPTNVIGKGKLNNISWEWDEVTQNTDNSTIEDLDGYQYRIYTASSGGTQIYPKAGGGAYAFTPDTQVNINDLEGDLTAIKRTLWLEVRAIDNSGNTSTTTSRVSAGTREVQRDDMIDNATVELGISVSAAAKPGVSQTTNVWYDVLTVIITTDRTGIIKIRYNGQWEDNFDGAQLQLLRASSQRKDFIYGSNIQNKSPVSLDHIESVSAGTYTYKIQERNSIQGGTGLGLIENSLSIQGEFK